jgi:hypothetical protein
MKISKSPLDYFFSNLTKPRMHKEENNSLHIEIEELPKSYNKEALDSRLTRLESENFKLREKLWKLQYRGTFPIAIALISTGCISLLFSFLLNVTTLTFIGLGLTLWGLVIFYISESKTVPEAVVNKLSFSMLKSIGNIVTGMKHKGKAIFLYAKNLNGLNQGYVFFSYKESQIPSYNELDDERIFYYDPKGIFIPAPSNGLVEMCEDQLGVDFATVDFAFLQQHLPKLMIENLRLVDDLTVEETDGIATIRFSGVSCVNLCKSVSMNIKNGNQLGCPLCSAFALMISKVSNAPININNTVLINGDTVQSTYTKIDI